MVFSADSNAIEGQIPVQIQRLETIKAQLEGSPALSQDLWDQAANTFQFFADAARQGTASPILVRQRGVLHLLPTSGLTTLIRPCPFFRTGTNSHR